MDLSSIIAELKREQERIGHAIASLLGGSAPSTPGRRGRKPGSGRKGGMSAAGRRNISLAMKRRWAERRAKGASPTTTKLKGSKPAASSGRGRSLTPAGRKRLSEMMKQRWAARKKSSE